MEVITNNTTWCRKETALQVAFC